MRSIAAIIIACTLTLWAASAQADYLQGYSGNSHPSTTGGLQLIEDFAVLDRLSGVSTPGDTFGTGFAGFDSLQSIDTSARFLYLYELTPRASGYANGSLGDGQPSFASVTSSAAWNLAFSDNAGIISASNSFGSDNAPFVPNAASSLGVSSPKVVSPTSTLAATTTSFSPTAFSFFTTPGQNQSTFLFGFTSNAAPILVPAHNSSLGLADGELPLPTVPEPSTFVLAALGLIAIFVVHRQRTIAV